MRTLLLAALLALCLAQATESTAPRRSLIFDVFPAGHPPSDSGKCWEAMLTLGLCKHDLLASFFTGCPVPRACCRAAGEVDAHCGPFTRAFVGSLLPRGLLPRCTAGAGHPGGRSPPPPRQAPAVVPPSPRVSGGARAPPPPRAETSVQFQPPYPPKSVSGGARTAPPPRAEISVSFPPPYPPKSVSGGARTSPAPRAETSVQFPPPYPPRSVSGGARTSPAPRAETRVKFPPPYPPRSASGGAQALPAPRAETSVQFPPPYPPRSSSGSYDVPPKAHTSARHPPPPPPHAPKVAAGGTGAYGNETRGAPAVPLYGGSGGDSRAPKPKVIGDGSAPLTASAAAPKGAPTTASPKSSPYGYGTPL